MNDLAVPMMALLGAFLAAQAAPAPASAPAEVRSVLVSVTDEKGAPVRDLQKDEVAVLENGVGREPVRIELDTRPLTVAVLVDTSEAVAPAYRLNIVPAVTSFVGRLPSGTRYALWIVGDRPTKLVDFTDDPAAAGKALARTIPQGGSTLLDAIVEASRELNKQEGARTALVAVTALGPEFSSRHRQGVVDEARKSGAGAVFYGVEFQEGPSNLDDRTSYDFVLAELAKSSGGLLETTLSSMGVASALSKIASDLSTQYRLSYATLPEAKTGKIEVKIARPGVKVRVGPSAAGDR